MNSKTNFQNTYKGKYNMEKFPMKYKTFNVVAEMMAQQLRSLVVLPEHWGLVPHTYQAVHNYLTPVPKYLMFISVLQIHCMNMVYRYACKQNSNIPKNEQVNK